MNVLVTLLLIVIILGIAFWIAGLLPIPEPFKSIALAIVGVIALLYLLGVLLGVTGIPTLRVT